MMQLIVNVLKQNQNSPGFLIDGFPRTLDQALEFERIISSPKFVISFSCPLETLEKRLLERSKTSGRADDNLETIRKRFYTYENESIAAIKYYERLHLLVQIGSARPIDQVFTIASSYFERLPFDGEKIVFVLGGPGSGKGTQCDQLANLGYAHISTGDLLRNEIKKGTKLGSKLEGDMKEGKMISLVSFSTFKI
jgi:adenylate kinase